MTELCVAQGWTPNNGPLGLFSGYHRLARGSCRMLKSQPQLDR